MNDTESEFLRTASELLIANGAGAELLGCFGLCKKTAGFEGTNGLIGHGPLHARACRPMC